MILVTGAAGKTGRAILQSLAQKGIRSDRIGSFTAQADSLLNIDGIECFIGDLRNPEII